MSYDSASAASLSTPLANVARRVNNPVFRCKKPGCSFYGNATWQGYCSACYREVHATPVSALASPPQLQQSPSMHQPQYHHNYHHHQQQQQQASPVHVPVAAPPPRKPTAAAPHAGSNHQNANTAYSSPPSIASILGSASSSSPPQQPSTRAPVVDDANADVGNIFNDELRKSETSESSTAKSVVERGVDRLLKAGASTRIFNYLRRGKKSGEDEAQSKSANNKNASTEPAEEPPAKEFTFHDFLTDMKKPQAQDLVMQTKRFIENFSTSTALSSEEQSESIQIFLQNMGNRISTHPLWKNSQQEELENAIDGIEKYVMTKLYSQVFSPSSTDDTAKDELIDQRIRRLRWVTLGHLGLDAMELNEKCDEPLKAAMHSLCEMDAKRAPQDKVACIVKCSKLVFTILQAMAGASHAASADEFLPVLIFTVIRAHPARLQSNLQYISRFCNPTRLISGEGGYFFTNMCCAVAFLENLQASSFKMDEQEFTR
ncbi:hypothetical protein, variant [Capsaspora owczarzaki ATCC 30864]|uniref:Rab5 GDP/GTP exchange factor n=1 Tax=Capsaspora owczarzaki (strain ATCC 30864) TaxID=595528 RepID=A0A0D2X4S1_CAPO3|nr:hypothetical protein, variant [Capsaspora owczarzaki ATCC 30864]